MKLPKNILILIASYLGMVVLICCVAQFLIPISKNANADVTVNAGDTEDPFVSPDLPTAGTAIPDDTDAGVKDTDADASTTVQNDLEAPNDEPPLYVLRTFKDAGGTAIGVYDANGTLIETLDTPLYALPVGDRALLEVGIEVSSAEDLEDLIEDFGG